MHQALLIGVYTPNALAPTAKGWNQQSEGVGTATMLGTKSGSQEKADRSPPHLAITPILYFGKLQSAFSAKHLSSLVSFPCCLSALIQHQSDVLGLLGLLG